MVGDTRIMCEPCGVLLDHENREFAEAQGWRMSWDGWVCPTCVAELSDEQTDQARTALEAK